MSIAGAAIASPYAYTGTFPTSGVTKCIFVLNNGAEVLLDPIEGTVAGTSFCKFDIATALNGNNVVSVSYKNL